MSTVRVKVGSVVRIQFLDHCSGGDEALAFTVYGKVSKITRETFTVDTWHYTSPKESDRGSNVERFNIVRSTITKLDVWKLR